MSLRDTEPHRSSDRFVIDQVVKGESMSHRVPRSLTYSMACVLGLLVATGTLTSAEPLLSVSIPGIPHVKQKPDFCGEACAEMWLRKAGATVDQDYVFDQSGLDPVLGRGCFTKELATALRKMGFRIGTVFTSIKVSEAEAGLDQAFAQLHADLKKGIPSIVCTHFDDQPMTTEHFRLVIGYDHQSDEVLYHDPALDDGADQRMARSMFLKLWPLKYAPDKWTLVRLRLDASRLPTATAADKNEFTPADYAQHILGLRERLPHAGFAIVIQEPFVVIGDEKPAIVKQRSEQTVKWAVERLKRQYFSQDPTEIIDIWLFRDAPSYEEYTEKLTNDKPGTPFGFYSPADQALFMNISTGGGTLVHEIVHPFIASNFPDCPSWFNEGLASLYEQSADRGGQIVGLTNWRLAGLQQAINEESVPSFQELCGTTTNEFYNRDRGTNYSQARYLCYHLQERRLLAKYYHAFRQNAVEDPTGYETLKTILGEPDMAEFQKRWGAETLKLEFQ